MSMSWLRPSLIMFALFTLLLGVIYPGAVTLIAHYGFKDQAEGSLLKNKKNVVIGSTLIGQNFTDPKYVWGRLSATTPSYNAASSSGSNQGVNAEALKAATQARIDALRAADPENHHLIPVDLVTASGSGLDPHISIAAALYQAPRIARLRGLSLEQVNALIDEATEARQWRIFGEPRVNVLKLNLALDASNESLSKQ